MRDDNIDIQVISAETFNIKNTVAEEYGVDTSEYFSINDILGATSTNTIIQDDVIYKYVKWGEDDQTPYKYLKWAKENLVVSQCQAFNVKAAYGQGLRFVERETGADTDNRSIRDFCLNNSLHRVFYEQVYNMKYFDFYVAVIVLTKDGGKIAKINLRDSCNCRFEKADEHGRINHVFYGDFRANKKNETKKEVLPLLDEYDPLGDLSVRMGRRVGADGRKQEPTTHRKFAIVCKMLSPGNFYYPCPAWTTIFRDEWYDIYRLIGLGKRQMIKHTSAPRIHIQIHANYLDEVCNSENILDPAKRKERKTEEIDNIKKFVTGVENAGKAMVSGFYVNPNGQEIPTVKFSIIGTDSDQGGAWSNDSAEAANNICFAMGVHPNLVGAVPGKSQTNNSGSDKRELFTLKQALEKSYQDIMATPYHLILHYNGLSNHLTVNIPMIILTTLDQNTDAKTVTNTNPKNSTED